PLVINVTQNRPFTYACIGGQGVVPGSGDPCAARNAAYPLNLTAIPTQAVWPYVQQWSLSVQREMPKNVVATLAYVGSKGTHLTAERQINQLAPVNPANNPFALNAPITFDVCNSYDGGTITVGFDQDGNPTKTVSIGQPGFVNLQAACFGTPG